MTPNEQDINSGVSPEGSDESFALVLVLPESIDDSLGVDGGIWSSVGVLRDPGFYKMTQETQSFVVQLIRHQLANATSDVAGNDESEAGAYDVYFKVKRSVGPPGEVFAAALATSYDALVSEFNRGTTLSERDLAQLQVAFRTLAVLLSRKL